MTMLSTHTCTRTAAMEPRPAGAGLARLPGRLTAELILRSPQYMSCIKLYELDLRGVCLRSAAWAYNAPFSAHRPSPGAGREQDRGHREPGRHRGADHGRSLLRWAWDGSEAAFLTSDRAQNQFDSIDLSDNNIVKLEGFPKLHRLKQLMLSNNRVARIARQLEGEPISAGGGVILPPIGAGCPGQCLPLPRRQHSEPGHAGPDEQQARQPAGQGPCCMGGPVHRVVACTSPLQAHASRGPVFGPCDGPPMLDARCRTWTRWARSPSSPR